MRQFNIEINGKAVATEAEARTHLADFLRERHHLTGTHIGCEHGVCGACTVLIDGRPARSCITFAVACEDACITTIEGLRDDPVMADLREAFSAHHALQCGYCTPGMLISCRDIVLRLPNAGEDRIRLELSGNLCRCTGYVGIVAAVKSVLEKRMAMGLQAPIMHVGLGPVGARSPAARLKGSAQRNKSAFADTPQGVPARQPALLDQWDAVQTDGVELRQSLRIPYPRSQVWEFFQDLGQVARCIPGATLTNVTAEGRGQGEIIVKLGPIVSVFAGAIEAEGDAARFTGHVRGAGRDAKSGSNARAVLDYRLGAIDGASTEVAIAVKFLLSGALAQIGRSGLVKDVANHLTRRFASNLEAAMSGKPIASQDAGVDAGAVALAVMWRRLSALLLRLKFWG